MTLGARFERGALIAGAAGLLACLAGGLIAGMDQFFRSYLIGVLFWIGVAFGCLGLNLLHTMTGGAWGELAKRPFHAAASTMPLCALLFAPLLAGLSRIYPWARADLVQHDELLRHKAAYLNTGFFVARAVIYFAVWSFLALALYRRASRRTRAGSSRTMRVIAGPGMVAAVLTMTFAAVDWIMSLDPHWTSTMFGLQVIVGALLSGVAFTIAVVTRAEDESDIPVGALHDLGNLMLVFVLIWAYFSFSQYLIIYAGNLAEDTPWYVHRTEGGWQHIALGLILLHFAVPFAVLLSRRTKRSPRVLGAVAFGILAMRLVEMFWFAAPNFYEHHVHVHWMDVAAPIGVGGVWLYFFCRRMTAFDPQAKPKAVKPALEGA